MASLPCAAIFQFLSKSGMQQVGGKFSKYVNYDNSDGISQEKSFQITSQHQNCRRPFVLSSEGPTHKMSQGKIVQFLCNFPFSKGEFMGQLKLFFDSHCLLCVFCRIFTHLHFIWILTANPFRPCQKVSNLKFLKITPKYF